MSNGCPIVSPDSKVMCITPVSPHTYSNRPLIVDSNDMIVISVDKNSIKHTVATLDGSNYMHIKNPSEVIVAFFDLNIDFVLLFAVCLSLLKITFSVSILKSFDLNLTFSFNKTSSLFMKLP